MLQDWPTKNVTFILVSSITGRGIAISGYL